MLLSRGRLGGGLLLPFVVGIFSPLPVGLHFGLIVHVGLLEHHALLLAHVGLLSRHVALRRHRLLVHLQSERLVISSNFELNTRKFRSSAPQNCL